jgi:5-methyltetrahydropteroyltriglutamate--homocysteine methyltransferase
MVKIKTTHVGSLPKSHELSSLLASKDNQEKIDIGSFDEVVKKNVSEVVKKQINTGIDSVSDGEMSKISYATYIKDRVDGFSGESERKAPKDLDDFPSFKKKLIRSGGTPSYTRPCCTNELKIKDTLSLTKDINNFKDALKESNHSQAFMNAASPGVISALFKNSSSDKSLNVMCLANARSGQSSCKYISLETISSYSCFISFDKESKYSSSFL